MELGFPPIGANSLADPGQRLLARLIDGGVIVLGFVVVGVVSILLGSIVRAVSYEAGGLLTGLLLLVGYAFALGYEVVMIATRGQTLGKMAMGVAVVNGSDGSKPSWGTAILRWVIQIIPFIGLLDALWLLWDPHRQCLHDKAASTFVVRLR